MAPVSSTAGVISQGHELPGIYAVRDNPCTQPHALFVPVISHSCYVPAIHVCLPRSRPRALRHVIGNVTPTSRGQGIRKGLGNRDFSPAAVNQVICMQRMWKQRFGSVCLQLYFCNTRVLFDLQIYIPSTGSDRTTSRAKCIANLWAHASISDYLYSEVPGCL